MTHMTDVQALALIYLALVKDIPNAQEMVRVTELMVLVRVLMDGQVLIVRFLFVLERHSVPVEVNVVL